MISEVISQVTGLFGKVLDTIDSLTTTEEEKLKLRNELQVIQGQVISKVLEYENALVKAQAQVVTAEATGHSWLQRNWRPITMLLFVFIIFYNYVFAPIVGLHSLPTPKDLWDLMKIGMGGYIVGRSGEKIVKLMRNK